MHPTLQDVEAYNELSKKLLEQESKEFGKLHYSSFTLKSDLNGITFEFETDEELDDSFKGKELGVTPTTSTNEDEEFMYDLLLLEQ
jgi:hypothetical protein